MEENKVMKELFGECLAYMKFGKDINPSRVKDMLKKAYEAGKEDSPKIINGGQLEFPYID